MQANLAYIKICIQKKISNLKNCLIYFCQQKELQNQPLLTHKNPFSLASLAQICFVDYQKQISLNITD